MSRCLSATQASPNVTVNLSRNVSVAGSYGVLEVAVGLDDVAGDSAVEEATPRSFRTPRTEYVTRARL